MCILKKRYVKVNIQILLMLYRRTVDEIERRSQQSRPDFSTFIFRSSFDVDVPNYQINLFVKIGRTFMEVNSFNMFRMEYPISLLLPPKNKQIV